MIYDWYNIANLTAFLALNLPSQNLTLELEGLGEKEIMITQGNETSILYDGVFLPLNFNEQNPFAFDGYAVHVDSNQDIWLGIENAG